MHIVVLDVWLDERAMHASQWPETYKEDTCTLLLIVAARPTATGADLARQYTGADIRFFQGTFNRSLAFDEQADELFP